MALGLLLLSSVVAAADTSRLAVGPLVLPLPAAWRITDHAERIDGRGPNGQTLIASYTSLLAGTVPDPAKHVAETARSFARDQMTGLAAKNGKLLHPLAETRLPDGRYEFFVASQRRRLLRNHYFMQYLLTSKQGMVYLAVEGDGDAEKAAAQFDTILASQQWLE